MTTPAPGSEPDYRFTLANERTLLAYLRSAMALIAAGVALKEVGAGHATYGIAARLLIAAGMLIPAVSYARWSRVQQRLRRSQPLPAPAAPLLLLATIIGASILVALA